MFDCTFGSPADHGALGSLPCPVEPGGCARALPIAQFFHAKQELPRILASSTPKFRSSSGVLRVRRG